MPEIIYLPELIQLWHDRWVAQLKRATAGEGDDDWFDDYVTFGTADLDDPFADDDSFPQWSPWIEAVCDLADELVNSQGELPNDWAIFVGSRSEGSLLAEQLEEYIHFPTGVVIHQMYADTEFLGISVGQSDGRKHVFITDRITRPEGIVDQIFTAIDTGRRSFGPAGKDGSQSVVWCRLADSNSRADWVDTAVDPVYRLGNEEDFLQRGETRLRITY